MYNQYIINYNQLINHIPSKLQGKRTSNSEPVISPGCRAKKSSVASFPAYSKRILGRSSPGICRWNGTPPVAS